MTAKASIMIDLRKNRIRVARSAIEMIGCPEYIHFMVNPDTPSLLVQPAEVTDRDAYRRYNKKEEIFYSTPLMKGLMNACTKFKNGNTYTITGNYISNINAVEFDLCEAVPFSVKEDDKR